MMTNAKIGVALVGGYLLGRTKKAKMAIGLGLFLAGKKLNLDPKQWGALVANSPVLGPLNDQVRSELVDATKAAAGTALSQRMSGLADSLHERTAALDEGRDVVGEVMRDSEDGRPAADDEVADEETAEDQAADDEAAATKSSARSSDASAKKADSDRRSAPARRSSASASGPARTAGKAARTSSGKAAAAASRERPATSSGRKAASGARKKASGAARTAADRGGRNG
ncbi:hypothetical protein [Streptomyces tubercidicus]|uniref:DNA primase n=2 Tax=Streptomyces tubercidicus TaxID=47759 RepID=A0A640V0X7_9ACTN|nr:hypothetical protein [Streptomyces tubercidicus]WAU15932.1 hypothetical protein STRTU_006687 [Streptomyces tubercidicus]GFE41829.1 hypothetical protein Stube_65020 [Streptomyces tubercidicus]